MPASMLLMVCGSSGRCWWSASWAMSSVPRPSARLRADWGEMDFKWILRWWIFMVGMFKFRVLIISVYRVYVGKIAIESSHRPSSLIGYYYTGTIRTSRTFFMLDLS